MCKRVSGISILMDERTPWLGNITTTVHQSSSDQRQGSTIDFKHAIFLVHIISFYLELELKKNTKEDYNLEEKVTELG